MKVRLISFLLFGFASFLGCNQSVVERATHLPQSGGRLGEVVVLSDKGTLDSSFKETINQFFNQPFWGVPLSEPIYRVVFSTPEGFKGYFKTHKNLLVLTHQGNLEMLKNALDPLNVEDLSKFIDSDNNFIPQKNIWAKNQSIQFVLGKNKLELLENLQNGKAKLLERMEQQEFQNSKFKLIGTNERKDSIYQRLMAERSFGIRFPSTYRLAVNKNDFIWIRKETRKYEFGIFIYEEPYMSDNQLTIDYISRLRNSKTKQYVLGSMKNSFMIIDPNIPLQSKTVMINGNNAIKTGGWWSLVSDFMGGPFLSYTILDEKNNRVITIEGNIYGPNENKVEVLRELEIILNTFKIK
jgi:hypothetical protein